MTDHAIQNPAGASHAERLHDEIVQGCEALRRVWIYVAERLYHQHRIRGWRDLGHRSWGAYLASPGIGLARSYADQLVRAWRVLVVEQGVDPRSLKGTDLNKVVYVLPAIAAGDVRPADALVDARGMSREDLRDRYVKDHRRDESVRRCPNCGVPLEPERQAA